MKFEISKVLWLNFILTIYLCKAEEFAYNAESGSRIENQTSKTSQNLKFLTSGITKSIKDDRLIQTSTVAYKMTTVSSVPEDTSETVLPDNEEQINLDSGPSVKESLGLQKALEWLRDKRFSDYGWGNDTHMVILAKEVRRFLFITLYNTKRPT